MRREGLGHRNHPSAPRVGHPSCSTERVDEQKQELMARGEGAQQLEADLVPSVDKLPSG